MPTYEKYIKPERLTTFRGVSVYYTYKDGCADEPSFFWFALSDEEDGATDFDIRDLPEAADLSAWPDKQALRSIFRAAIKAGHLTTEGIKGEGP